MDEEPPVVDLRVDLAGPTYPVLLLSCLLVSPQGINVHDRKSTILFFGNLDSDRSSLVVHKFVLGEQ